VTEIRRFKLTNESKKAFFFSRKPRPHKLLLAIDPDGLMTRVFYFHDPSISGVPILASTLWCTVTFRDERFADLTTNSTERYLQSITSRSKQRQMTKANICFGLKCTYLLLLHCSYSVSSIARLQWEKCVPYNFFRLVSLYILHRRRFS
jgi:hypothetical protein